MSETVAPAGASAPSGSGGPAAAVGEVASTASAAPGNAPGNGVDATAEVGAAGTPAPGSAAFRFLNRQFNDQKHAEEVFGSEVGRVRTMQRENAQLKERSSALEAELNALRQMVGGQSGQHPGQGMSRGPQAPDAPLSLADKLKAKSGDFAFYQKIAEDPEMGLGHAFFALANDLGGMMQEEVANVRDSIQQEIQGRDLRSAQERGVAGAIGALHKLTPSFPELDPALDRVPEDQLPPEVIEARQGILETAKMFSPEQLAQNPEFFLTMAALYNRHTRGTPLFAQAPGTSDSPSYQAATAAENAARATQPPTLDGSGVPRQRPGGSAESLAEKIRRENAQLPREATSPSGRKLGFAIGS